MNISFEKLSHPSPKLDNSNIVPMAAHASLRPNSPADERELSIREDHDIDDGAACIIAALLSVSGVAIGIAAYFVQYVLDFIDLG